MTTIVFRYADQTKITMVRKNIPAMGENVKINDKIYIVDDVTHDLDNDYVTIDLI